MPLCPIQLFKNYRYYEYVQQHGGYLSFFVNHGDVASSVPLLVRAIVLISFPAFVAIFVFERRKKYLYLADHLVLRHGFAGSAVGIARQHFRAGPDALVCRRDEIDEA